MPQAENPRTMTGKMPVLRCKRSIRGRDTRPERGVRPILHRLGTRFTVNGPKNRSLPGKPDIVCRNTAHPGAGGFGAVWKFNESSARNSRARVVFPT